MAKVRVCDRCGEKIPTKRGMKIRKRGFRYHRFLLKTETQYTFGEHDLCPDCMKDFIAFMDGTEIVRKEDTDGVR